jgi:hypothetical protein
LWQRHCDVSSSPACQPGVSSVGPSSTSLSMPR